jgi:putative endonuclease
LSKHNELGRNGEILACQFLINKGHQILATNYRSGHKEIDIISTDKAVLVFSEIKTRSSYDFGFPEEAIHGRKKKLLLKAAEAYLAEHSNYIQIRFDVISILIRYGKPAEILHFEDAFYE